MLTDPGDGLPIAKVGDWAEDKYLLVEHYARMFARAMKGKWNCRVYLELYSGPGRAKIEGATTILDTASLRSLELDPGFDLHVYGELDLTCLAALEARCHARRPNARCRFVGGDVNQTWPSLREQVREAAGGGTYLTFCFVDPFRCADLAFATLRGLSELYADFLILVPSFMDANRNRDVYLQEGNAVLDRFLGDRSWRESWSNRERPMERFGEFVADQLGVRMARLGFRYEGLDAMKLMRSTDRNLPLYHLAFFSRSELGVKFWREARKASDPQRRLF
jgi:three-Cys-motif partner protein